ncbi:MAG TPA: hypothetical protein EYP14_14265 [Planctomycetaceae bacterium]|nr:hypothetical protein [Planctomycetaceae bacterium]
MKRATRADGDAARPVPLNAKKTVLLDKAHNRLLLKTEVTRREGLLEMLCCLKHTKEHESILAVDAKAYVVHAGLLALGARPGRPVQFVPKYRPPAGQRIDIFVRWKDQNGAERREKAQRWVRYARYRFHVAKLKALPPDVTLPEDSPLRFDARNHELTWYGPMTKKQRDELLALTNDQTFRDAINRFFQQSLPREMDTDWVFVGSGFYKDPETGETHYMAEGGDLICVANFPSATIDVAIPSTSSGTENLLFEAYTERIPPIGTQVMLELIPSKDRKHDGKRDTKRPSGNGE